MEYPRPWVDAEEWPEPPSSEAREVIRSLVQRLERRSVIAPAVQRAREYVPPAILASPCGRRVLARYVWRYAAEAVARN